MKTSYAITDMNRYVKVAFAVLITVMLFSCMEPEFVVSTRLSAPVFVQPVSPGHEYVWIEGEWFWNGRGYAWRDGYWALPSPGYVWVPGYWHGRGHGWYWHQGHWHR